MRRWGCEGVRLTGREGGRPDVFCVDVAGALRDVASRRSFTPSPCSLSSLSLVVSTPRDPPPSQPVSLTRSLARSAQWLRPPQLHIDRSSTPGQSWWCCSRSASCSAASCSS